MSNRQQRITWAVESAQSLISSNFSTYDAVDAACREFALDDAEAFDIICQILAM